MGLLWRSSEDPPCTFGVTHCLSGTQHPTAEASEDPSRVLEHDGTEEKKEGKGFRGSWPLSAPPVSTRKSRGGKAEALLMTIREQEFNLHALNELLEVLISLPRALREGD